MIPALVFIPPIKVIDASDTLQETVPPEADPLIDYFEDTYIGRRRRHNRLATCFPVSMWNISGRVAEDLPRTSNSLERWHNHIQANITSCIWIYGHFLKRGQALISVIINQILVEHLTMSKRKRYDSTVRITNIVYDLKNRHIMDFLRCIANHLQF